MTAHDSTQRERTMTDYLQSQKAVAAEMARMEAETERLRPEIAVLEPVAIEAMRRAYPWYKPAVTECAERTADQG